MTDTTVAPSPADLAGQVAELQRQLAQLVQTQQTGQGGTYPHAGILSGAPAHTVLGPCDATGKVLPGAWNLVTGLWEDPDTAAKNAEQAKADEQTRIAAAKDQAEADLKAKARAIAIRELAEEANLGDLVDQAKNELRANKESSDAPQSSTPTGSGPASAF